MAGNLSGFEKRFSVESERACRISISDRNSSTSFLILGKLDTIPANMAAFGNATLCSNSVEMRLNASKRVATSFGVA